MNLPELVRKFGFYTLFNMKKRKFKNSLSFIEESEKKVRFKKKIVILPIIETSHYKYLQHLIIAKALEIRGAKIIVLICGESLRTCEIRSSANNDKDPCWRCRFGAKNYLPLFGFKTISLADIKKNLNLTWPLENEKKKNFINETKCFLERCIQESLTRHHYGKIINDPVRYDMSFESAYISWMAAKYLYKKYKPDFVLGYMAAYSEWEPIFRYFKSVNVDFRLVTSTPFSNTGQMLDWPDLHLSSERYDKFRMNRNEKKLSFNEKKILKEFVDKRFSGKDDVMRYLGVARNLKTVSFLKKKDKSKKIIAIFPNVHWDVGLGDLNTIFPSMMDWLYETIDFLGNKKNIEVLLRLHPVEYLYKKNGSSSVIDLIKAKLRVLPSNLNVIDSGASFSSYSLFNQIDVGVTYQGSIGLEMLLREIPTVITGKAHYSFISGTCNPKSKLDYFKTLTGDLPIPKPLKRDVDLFSFFYFFKSAIPWKMTSLSYGAGNFDYFKFDSLNELLPGKDPHLDHLCECLFDKQKSPESWNYTN